MTAIGDTVANETNAVSLLEGGYLLGLHSQRHASQQQQRD
jgi:hypothetical protein